MRCLWPRHLHSRLFSPLTRSFTVTQGSSPFRRPPTCLSSVKQHSIHTPQIPHISLDVTQLPCLEWLGCTSRYPPFLIAVSSHFLWSISLHSSRHTSFLFLSFFFFFFLNRCAACRILVPGHQGLNRLLREQSPNHWRTREFPLHSKSVRSQTHPSSLSCWTPATPNPELQSSHTEPLLASAGGHLHPCSNLLSFPGASGLCALLHLFPGHKIQCPDSWVAAWRVRESEKALVFFSHNSPTQCLLLPCPVLFPLSSSYPYYSQPTLTVDSSLSADFPNLSSPAWLSCPGFWPTRCPWRWLPLQCLPPWPPSMQTSTATLLTPTRCDFA